ncbi:MAG TPA: hypothetical protein VLE53_01740 [Gemmatimonadaceae bacterium]|nr:hypothetical protein [Gemmatimonadaceae bacterium]
MPRRHGLSLVLTGLCAASAAAQSVPVVTLSRPVAEFAEPFSEIASIRELSDGRVIVVDGRELTVQMIDFRSGNAQPVGRKGPGPGEYEWPQRLFGLPGDTTVLQGGAGGRLLVITPDGTPGAFLDIDPPAAADPRARVTPRFTPRFADARGRLYSQAQPIRYFSDGRPPELTDSAAIVRLDRATEKRDTVGYMPLRPDPTRRIAGSIGVVFAPNYRPWPAWDAWTVGPDGRIAMVFNEPYRVNVIDVTGVRVNGQPIPYQRVRVDEALKDEWRAEQARPRMAMTARRGGPATIGLVKSPVREPGEWPEFLPAFKASGVSVAPDGMAWVQRMVAAGAPLEYDLIDGRGRLVRKVRLPRRSHVIGFGTGTVYVVRMDDDDLQYLQRHPLPRL